MIHNNTSRIDLSAKESLCLEMQAKYYFRSRIDLSVGAVLLPMRGGKNSMVIRG